MATLPQRSLVPAIRQSLIVERRAYTAPKLGETA
jgi:hypothetical protein